MPLILGANSVSGYTVKNSLRVEGASSDSLNRNFATSGNRKTFTLSFWFKKVKNATSQSLFRGDTALTTNYNHDSIYIDNSDKINFGGYTSNFIVTTAVFRDLSAWYHIVLSVDTTQATTSNRIKLYVNNIEQARTEQGGYPAQNTDLAFTKSGNHAWFGSDPFSGLGYGYLAEAYLIDGQALTPSSFGETDTASGIWIPKAYTGTYGTNGFFLKFLNSASLGTDSSGNGNTFTVNNLTSVDQSTDTPTNNFATMNPLDFAGASPTLTNGNLTVASSSNDRPIRATMGFSKGKWYAEYRFEASDNDNHIGCYSLENSLTANYIGSNLYSWGLVTSTGNKRNNAVSTSYGSAIGYANSIVMIAIDKDNGKIWWGKDGTWFNSGNPANGTNEAFSNINTVVGANGFVTFSDVTYRNGSWNFGNPAFTISSGNTDGAGFGNFEYAVPSGYYALCTKNLATFG